MGGTVDLKKITNIGDLDFQDGAVQEMVRAVMGRGVVVDLDVGRWRGQTVLTAGDLFPEEGAEFRTAFDKLIRGSRWIFPKAELARLGRVEDRLRKEIQLLSYRTFWGYYIPTGLFTRFLERFAAEEKIYREEAQALADSLDLWRGEMESEYRILLKDRLPNGTPMEEVIARIMAFYPSPEGFMDKIKFEFHFVAIQPSAVEQAIPAEFRAYYDPVKACKEFFKGAFAEFSALIREEIEGLIRSLSGDKLHKARTRIKHLRRIAQDMNIFGLDLSEIDALEEALAKEEKGRILEIGNEFKARFAALEI